MERREIPNNLICGVQAFGLDEDCDQPLISDGGFWRCPYGHIQGYDSHLNPVREIPDKRWSVKR